MFGTYIRIVLIISAHTEDRADFADLRPFRRPLEETERIGKKLPEVTFKTRLRDDSLGGPNPHRWAETTTADVSAGKRVVLFSLPGAFPPTCSTYQLPEFEKLYQAFAERGIDEITCISVNDAFVMNAWGRGQGLVRGAGNRR